MRSASVISSDLRVAFFVLVLLYAGSFAVARLLGATVLLSALLALVMPYVAFVAWALLGGWRRTEQSEPPTLA